MKSSKTVYYHSKNVIQLEKACKKPFTEQFLQDMSTQHKIFDQYFFCVGGPQKLNLQLHFATHAENLITILI